jgi:hypothetical protein
MRPLLLGLGVGAGIGYAAHRLAASPQPQPPWEETDNDPEDLSADLAQRARDAEGAQGTAEETPAT